MRWGALFLLNCLPAKAKRNSETMLRLGLYSKQKMAELMADTKVEFHHLSHGTLHIFSEQGMYDHAREQAEFQSKLGCNETPMTRDECIALEPRAGRYRQAIGGRHARADRRVGRHSCIHQKPRELLRANLRREIFV